MINEVELLRFLQEELKDARTSEGIFIINKLTNFIAKKMDEYEAGLVKQSEEAV